MELLTAKDVAARLKISPRQVWKLASAGRLPAPVRVGGSRSVRWRAADVAFFIEHGCDMKKCEAARAGEDVTG